MPRWCASATAGGCGWGATTRSARRPHAQRDRARAGNRLTARALQRFGFAGYWREWWHFEHRVGRPRYLDLALGCRAGATRDNRQRPSRFASRSPRSIPPSATSAPTPARSPITQPGPRRRRGPGRLPEPRPDGLPARGPPAEDDLPRRAGAALDELAGQRLRDRRAGGSWSAPTTSTTRRPCSPTARWWAVYRKIYLPNYGVFDEQRHFQSGSEAAVFEPAACRSGSPSARTSGSPGRPRWRRRSPAPR